MIITLETKFSALLREKIEAEMEKSARLLAGGIATSFEDYRQRVGYLAGLGAALKLAEEVELYLNGPERSTTGTQA